MKVKCEYCDNFIDDTLETCPHCGAENVHMARSAAKEPKTIEELQAFCRARNVNLERMHFHIGENYKGPKAFGIYRDEDGNFVVYKNKADGSRAVRYRGTDEAFAVNEIYQKLKAEVLEVRKQAGRRSGSQKSAAQKSTGSRSYQYTKSTKNRKLGCLIVVLVICLWPIALGLLSLLLESFGISLSGAEKGYYDYNGSTYYNSGSSWYEYVDDDWYRTDYDDDYFIDYDDHFVYDYSGTPFDDGSDAYSSWESSNNWSDDWDDDDWDDDDDDWSWGWDDDDDDDDWSWDDDDDDWDWDSGSDWDSDW